ncbi:MAG TPA: hypothetical protein VFJ91_01485 [Gaiellaceae bacterium]|nr:hypothetical protein [Gaiellaceae bacterium]
MARHRLKRKTEHPSGRPDPKQPSNRLLQAKVPQPRAPRLPGHGMR